MVNVDNLYKEKFVVKSKKQDFRKSIDKGYYVDKNTAVGYDRNIKAKGEVWADEYVVYDSVNPTTYDKAKKFESEAKAKAYSKKQIRKYI